MYVSMCDHVCTRTYPWSASSIKFSLLKYRSVLPFSPLHIAHDGSFQFNPPTSPPDHKTCQRLTPQSHIHTHTHPQHDSLPPSDATHACTRRAGISPANPRQIQILRTKDTMEEARTRVRKRFNVVGVVKEKDV